jgi:hypothetical protein
MDFVHDALAYGLDWVLTATHKPQSITVDHGTEFMSRGRRFGSLTVVDQWSRQSPLLEVALSMSGGRVGPCAPV